jgi:hypothetical protein
MKEGEPWPQRRFETEKKRMEARRLFAFEMESWRQGWGDPSLLDEEALEALADEMSSAILRESARLQEREKEIILGIARQFAG